jgi:thioredoxin:protein disulfide reductase
VNWVSGTQEHPPALRATPFKGGREWRANTTPKLCFAASVIATLLFCVSSFAQLPAIGGGDFNQRPLAGPTVTAEGFTATDGVLPGTTFHAAIVLNVSEGWHINGNKPLDEFLIPTKLILEPPEGFTVTGTVYPEAELLKLGFQEDELAVYEGQVPIGVVIDVADGTAPGDYSLPGAVRYQACNDRTCAPPKTMDVAISVKVVPDGTALTAQQVDLFKTISFSAIASSGEPDTSEPGGEEAVPEADDWREHASGFSVTGRNSGYMGAVAFMEWLDGVEAGTAQDDLNAFAGKGVLAIVLATLIGGLLLNLTPCVLPVIPINLAIIGAGAQSGSKARGFLLGGAYGAGIALTYGVLGMIAVLTGASFGGINASPWFNLAIAVIFIALALAMFDVFLIDFTRFQSKINASKGKKGSFGLAFTMGGIAALLAGACVAPVVIFVILFARGLYADGAIVALGLPFLLGVGMALPWPFAGGGLSFLPRPGLWMNRVKQAFGVIILLIALYYGALSYSLFSERYLLDSDEVGESVVALDEQGWTSSLAQGLAQARAEGKPVFIDFWATWCKNCLTMNKTTFKDPAVMQRLDGYVKVKYKAQAPDESPARDVMDHLGVGGLGLPVYVILNPDGTVKVTE